MVALFSKIQIRVDATFEAVDFGSSTTLRTEGWFE